MAANPVTPQEDTEVIVDPEVLDACDKAWREHQKRCEEDRPYTDGVTTEDLLERITELRGRG